MHAKAWVVEWLHLYAEFSGQGTSFFPLLPCEAVSHWTGILQFGQLAVQQTLGISLSLLSYDMFTQGIVSLTRTFAGVCLIGTQTLRLAKEAPTFYEPLSCARFWFSYKIHLPFRISLFLSCSCFSPSSQYNILSCFIPKSDPNKCYALLAHFTRICMLRLENGEFFFVTSLFYWEIFFPLAIFLLRLKIVLNAQDLPFSSR